jgi:hypothetical protein
VRGAVVIEERLMARVIEFSKHKRTTNSDHGMQAQSLRSSRTNGVQERLRAIAAVMPKASTLNPLR